MPINVWFVLSPYLIVVDRHGSHYSVILMIIVIELSSKYNRLDKVSVTHMQYIIICVV